MTLNKRRYPGWSSQPEAGGQMPSELGPDLDEWKRILEESYGRIAADIAEIRRHTLQASDESARLHIGVTDLALANVIGSVPKQFTIPTGPWRSLIVSRPSYNEVIGNAFYSNDIYLTFDGAYSVVCGYQMLTIAPFLGWKTVQAVSNSGVPPSAKFAFDIFFTSREYPASAYTGF